MQTLPFVVAALVAASPVLLCQEEMPNPKQKEHAVLQSLAGDWEFTMKMAAVPGVPGMEKPVESTGYEHAELVCDGLWLKSSFNSTHDGKPFQGIWLAGYDPFTKKYRSYFVGSDDQECGMSEMDGTYDAKTKTWTWTCSTPQGDMRSVYVMKDADNSVETCYMTPPDGEEQEFMVMTRKRAKSPRPAAVDASIKVPALSAEHQMLHKDIGVWNAAMKMMEPGQEPMMAKATERVTAACCGRWLWTDYEGEIMGGPFEGHAVVGYDPAKGQYVSLWIDSMSPVGMVTTGTYDEAKKALTLRGSGVDPMGGDMKVEQIFTWKDADTRLLQMEFKGEERSSSMEITYRRQK